MEAIATPTLSGKGQKISRCPTCRVALWSNYAGAGDAVRFVRVGTLDEPDRLPPDIHIFTASKQPWVALAPGIPAVEEYYKASEYWPKASLERRALLQARRAAVGPSNHRRTCSRCARSAAAGNRRFVADVRSRDTLPSRARRIELAAGQEPFAAILGCSDSRVPVEIVFDQGLGDLFVIRVAGNIVAPSQIGSVEFAAEQFGTRLVVVLGHSRCGAIEATLEQLQRPKENQSRNLHAIVDLVRPSVEGLLATDLETIWTR